LFTDEINTIMTCLLALTSNSYRENEDPARKAGRIGGHVGGEKGGKVSANQTNSAAAVAKTLSGISFHISKKEIVNTAQKISDKVEDGDAVIDILNQLPDKQYVSIADIKHEVGKIK
jgi:uncharacterized protein DUF2795